MNIIRSISDHPDNDESFILENIDSIADDAIDFSKLSVRCTDYSGNGTREIEWKSLKEAVAWLFCSAAARRVYRKGISDESERGQRKNRWTTMIFNVSHEQIWQNRLSRWVRRYLSEKLQTEVRQDFITDCLRVWEEQKSAFKMDDFRESCSDNYPGVVRDYPNEADFREALEWFVDHAQENVRIVEINSSAEGHDGSEAYYDDTLLLGSDVAWILCGGNVISRGLTLEGLTTSYFNRVKDGSVVDTITQMGRWFGYRGGYELLPRLWMTQGTRDEMRSIGETERLMHAQLHNLFEEVESEYDEAGEEVGNRPLSPILDKGR